jgi:outer membrane immunogenic protein
MIKQGNNIMTTRNTILPLAMLLAIAAAGTTSSACAKGFRLEAHGGWDRAQSDGVKSDGVLYGIGAGYDVDLGKGLFAGIEANADFSTAKECANGIIAAGDRLCVRAGRDLSLIARAGVEVQPGSSLYALAGWTNARVRGEYKPATGPVVNEAQNLDGWRVGAGFQQQLGKGLYAKLEYRYSDYQDGDNRHQVVAGFGITF